MRLYDYQNYYLTSLLRKFGDFNGEISKLHIKTSKEYDENISSFQYCFTNLCKLLPLPLWR